MCNHRRSDFLGVYQAGGDEVAGAAVESLEAGWRCELKIIDVSSTLVTITIVKVRQSALI